jgi:hypothetical protein
VFFSSRGHVSIDYVDATRIEGSFHVTLRGLELLDGVDQLQLVEATATGDFAGPFAPGSPERELLAQINRPYEEVYHRGSGV